MSYYIKAYRGNRKINLQVEEKHLYYHTLDGHDYDFAIKPTTQEFPGSGEYLLPDQLVVLFKSNDIRFKEGTGNDEIIGQKVHIKSANYCGYLAFNYSFINNNYSQPTGVDLRFNFRFMIVKFDNELPHDTKQQLADWFNNNYIYYDSVTKQNSTNIRKLRESTKDTGKFKILYDESYTLTGKHTAQMLNFTIPGFSGTANTQQTGDTADIGKITNEDLKDIVCFVIGPINILCDVDCMTSEKWNSLTAGKKHCLC